MTEREQRIAIAEELTPADMTERECNEVFIWREGMIPDYPNDLNAMHEAEEVLLRDPENSHWAFKLDAICKRNSTLPIRATARQRAEAFLRTIGKWED